MAAWAAPACVDLGPPPTTTGAVSEGAIAGCAERGATQAS